MGNMIAVPITKEWRLLHVSKFVSFLRLTLIIWNMWKENIFLQTQSINIVYPNKENIIVVPITKRVEIITSIQVCLISQMKINYKESGGKQNFSCISKALKLCNLIWEHDCSAIKKKNGDYYEYPSLSHFMDEL